MKNRSVGDFFDFPFAEIESHGIIRPVADEAGRACEG
jgi:hypothetical protein